MPHALDLWQTGQQNPLRPGSMNVSFCVSLCGCRLVGPLLTTQMRFARLPVRSDSFRTHTRTSVHSTLQTKRERVNLQLLGRGVYEAGACISGCALCSPAWRTTSITSDPLVDTFITNGCVLLSGTIESYDPQNSNDWKRVFFTARQNRYPYVDRK